MNSYCKRQVQIFYRLGKKTKKKAEGEWNDHLPSAAVLERESSES